MAYKDISPAENPITGTPNSSIIYIYKQIAGPAAEAAGYAVKSSFESDTYKWSKSVPKALQKWSKSDPKVFEK